MDENLEKRSIQEGVQEAIASGRVKMHSRFHFILLAILAVLGGIILGGLLVYLISFIIFTTQQSGVGLIPAFGLRGWLRFFVALPWHLILLSLLFIFILQLLTRRYSFSYRQPLLYSALGIIALVIIGGVVVVGARFHERLSGYADRHHLPLVPGFYHAFTIGRDDIHPGVVSDLATSSSDFFLTDRSGRVLEILVASDTVPQPQLQTGEHVVVFGDFDGTSTVRAFGIRMLTK